MKNSKSWLADSILTTIWLFRAGDGRTPEKIGRNIENMFDNAPRPDIYNPAQRHE
jgi:hypothetical protein